ncbi:hypothetical protein BGX27_002765 [Mortierella sp. AM989]|nr:hypothetical protein BGX27_002765 [Mortierella sp. AM989]
MLTVEKALFAIFGGALVVTILALFACFLRRKKKSHHNSNSTQTQTQIQHPLSLSIISQPQSQPQRPLPLHQPSESPSSLSSFTRISSTSPEMISIPSSSSSSSPRIATMRSTSAVGFSLARFFSKQSTASTSAKDGQNVYLHGRDYSLQKTPSAPSSLNDYYYWDFSQTGKDCTKDEFPVITLTSPTNSESSIAFLPQPPPSSPPPQDDVKAAVECRIDCSSSSACSSTSPSFNFISSEGDNHSGISSFILQVEDSSSSSSSSPKSLQNHPYLVQQSVPQHMLLHPSYSYTKPIQFEKQQSTLSSSSAGTPTDFPPTYEEAVDSAGPSNNTKASSEGLATGQNLGDQRPSNSDANVSDTLTIDLTEQSRAEANFSSTCSMARSSPSAPLYEESGWTERVEVGRDVDTDAGISSNVDEDPLASLSLGRTSMQSLIDPLN